MSPTTQPHDTQSATPLGIWVIHRLVGPGLFLSAGIMLIVLLGLAQRMGWLQDTARELSSTVGAVAGKIFTCAMHPQIRQPSPGRCPICGMELVEAAGGTADLNTLSITIDPAQRRLANIQTDVVRKGPVQATIESVGAIAIDESRKSTISSYTKGRIERLFADYTGVHVTKNDHLAVVYSPELYAAQVEYVEASKTLQKTPTSTLPIVRETQLKLQETSRRRLVELGMTEDQLLSLEKTGEAQSRLTIFSPTTGTVIEKLAFEGMYVDVGEPIYRIAGLSTVWLMLELFPEDASRVRFGQRVSARIQSLPGETIEGRIAFIDPTVDHEKRSVGVRVEFLNEDGRLRPGDYATATITLPIGQTGEVYDDQLAGKWISPMHPQIIREEPGSCPICGMDLVPTKRFGFSGEPVPQPESIYVPRSAVLMAGDNSVVYVETEPGRFEIRPVTIGPILKERVVILNGLKPGEQVATAGNFLIDSQMQLAGKPSLIDPIRALPTNRMSPTPRRYQTFDVATIEGETGQKLEDLFAAYFQIQSQFALDQRPTEKSSQSLHQLAVALQDNEELPASARTLIKTIVTEAGHLNHLDLSAARLDPFRKISRAVITLATQVRGKDASEAVTQFHCPMVKGGGADWLQSGNLKLDALRNPYWGKQMLDCGELWGVFPPHGNETPSLDADTKNAPKPEAGEPGC